MPRLELIVALLAPRFALHGRISPADVQSASEALSLIASHEDARLEHALGEPTPEALAGVGRQKMGEGTEAFFPRSAPVVHSVPTHRPPSSPDDVGPSSHTLASPQPSFGDAVPVSSPVPAR